MKSKSYPIQKGKPSFKESNDVGPVPEGNNKGGTMDTSIFNKSALGSEISPTQTYAKGGKGGSGASCLPYNKSNSVDADSAVG